MKKSMLILVGVAGVGLASATDYTWLANPASSDWLTGVNWSTVSGDVAWSAGADDTATFGASSQMTVNIDGAVTVTNLVVGGTDYLFTGGPLTVNGPVDVAEGVAATVSASFGQTATEGTKRLFKTGKGTLVVKGSAETENVYQRIGQDAGTLVFKGGRHTIDVATTSASDSEVPLCLKGGRLEVTGGARINVTNGTYLSSAGGELFITNGTFNCMRPGAVTHFLNAYGTPSADGVTHPGITVSGNGRFEGWTIRPSQDYAATENNCGTINVLTGGTFVAHNFWMEKGPTRPIYARMFFDGGNLVFTNLSSETSGINRFDEGDKDSNKRWQNVTLAIGAGGLNLWTRNLSWYRKSFSSGAEKDGGLHIHGSSVPYLDYANTFNGGVHIYDTVTLATFQDTALGVAPETPTDRVFLNSSSAKFHFGSSYATHKNRDFLINTNQTGWIGTQNNCTSVIRGRIHGVEADGRSSRVRIASDWTGLTSIETADNRTNHIGKLFVQGRVQFGAGTTLITSNCLASIGLDCPFYVEGDGAQFSDYKGNLTVTGGVLRVVPSCYMQLSKYGQLNVKGGTVDLSSREFLNGLTTPGRTTVTGGELICTSCRISQCPTLLDGLPAASINVCTGGTLKVRTFYIDTKYDRPYGCLNLNGGTVVARGNVDTFLGNYTTANYSKVPGDNYGKWTNILVRVCAGGAIIDTVGYTVGIRNPLLSGVDEGVVDGGLTKKGSGTLTIANTNVFANVCNTNTYTGVTRIEAGTLKFLRAEGGFPGGDLEFPAEGLANASPLVMMPKLAFRPDHGLRIADAELLDDRTFGKARTIVQLTTPLTSIPPVSFVSTNGTTLATANGWKGWTVALANGGTELTFGPVRGTIMIFR